MTSEFSLGEQITAALSRQFRDGDTCFTGLTTGPGAVTFGTCIPLAAMALAQQTHAPNLTILFAGWSVNPQMSRLTRLPDLEFANEFMSMPAEAHITGYPNSIGYKRGDVTVGFSVGAQVDRFGSLNSTLIGDIAAPKVRLVGPILQPLHFTHFGREFVMMPRHDSRTFVESVDYRSGAGHQLTGKERAAAGLNPDAGPALVVSPLGLFTFDGPGSSMSVLSLNPGINAEHVRENTGFDVAGLDHTPITADPTEEELRILRTSVDPNNVLGLRGMDTAVTTREKV